MKKFTIVCLMILGAISLSFVTNLANAQHFNFGGGNAADPVWTLYIAEATLDGTDLEAGDEIGVFDGDILVGAMLLTQVCTPDNVFENSLAAFKTLNSGPGYTVGNSVLYKCWDASEDIEVENASIFYADPYGGAWTENFFPNGDGQYSIPYITFSSGGTISGIVTLNGGPGNVTEVLVTVGDVSVNPNDEGYYEITPLDPGNYDVFASLDAYYPETESAEVIAGEVTTVDFTLNPEVGNIAGTVTDEFTGEPLEDVLVSIGESLYETWTAADGTYLLSDILIGVYGVTASIDNYYPETISGVEVIVDETTTVDFELMPEPGTIEGTITLAGGPGNVTEVDIIVNGSTYHPDEYGYYEISGLNPGEYELSFLLTAYYPESVSGVEVFSNQATTVDITLLPEVGNIAGTVTDELTGEPLEDVLVSIGESSYETWTAADGTYLVSDILIGMYDVTASIDNYYPETISDVEVIVDETTIIDFELMPQPGIIDGTIVLAGGPGNVTEVEIIVNGSTYYPDEYGYYEVSGLNPGEYELSFLLAAYYPETVSGVEVFSNQATTVDITLLPEVGNIEGIVTSIDLDGEPIQGATITADGIRDDADSVYRAYTNEDGYYIIEDVLIGTYNVTAEAYNYYPETIYEAEVIVDETTTVDFELTPEPGIIDGIVYDNHTGEVIEGALISIEGTSIEAYTNSDGYYLIENVTIGIYNVMAFAENYESETIVDVEVFSNETTTVDFYLVPEPGSLEGTVIDEFSLLPIEGALITIDGTGYFANTNSDGYYFIEYISVGEYTVIATADNYFESIEYDVEIFSNEVTTVDFELHPAPGSIEGYVINAFTGDPIEGVFINVEDIYYAYTDGMGYYIINEVEVGTYAISVEIDGYYPEEETAIVLSNQTTLVNFELYQIHFEFPGGNASDPVWTIYLSGATFEEIDLNDYDEITIFDGETMVGKIRLTQVCTPDNQYENVLIAWSTLQSGETGYTPGNEFSLKCWDASEGLEVENFDITFYDPYGDAYVGDVFPEGDGQYSFMDIDFFTAITQTYNLSFGYQFISARTIPETPYMTDVFTDVLDNLDFVRNTAGAMLRKIGPNWINSIGDLVTEEGYLVRMNNADYMEIEGVEIDPQTPIELSYGFQFISYLPDAPMDALIAFADILDNLDFVRNTAGAMLRKIGPNWINSIGDLNPGEAYIVRMNDADILIYPESAEKFSGINNLQPQHFKFNGGNAADPVYTIYIDGLEIGDEVAAFDGNKLLGSTVINSFDQLDNDLSIFSTITEGSGYKNGNEIILKVWSAYTGEINIVDFVMNNNYEKSYNGKVYPSEDGQFSLVSITKNSSTLFNNSDDVIIYPNPASDFIKITSKNQITSIKLLNSVGKLVYQSDNIVKDIQIDISCYQSGVYVLQIITANKIITKKITIK